MLHFFLHREEKCILSYQTFNFCIIMLVLNQTKLANCNELQTHLNPDSSTKPNFELFAKYSSSRKWSEPSDPNLEKLNFKCALSNPTLNNVDILWNDLGIMTSNMSTNSVYYREQAIPRGKCLVFCSLTCRELCIAVVVV